MDTRMGLAAAWGLSVSLFCLLSAMFQKKIPAVCRDTLWLSFFVEFQHKASRQPS
jgi:hypothetical protein